MNWLRQMRWCTGQANLKMKVFWMYITASWYPSPRTPRPQLLQRWSTWKTIKYPVTNASVSEYYAAHLIFTVSSISASLSPHYRLYSLLPLARKFGGSERSGMWRCACPRMEPHGVDYGYKALRVKVEEKHGCLAEQVNGHEDQDLVSSEPSGVR